MIKAALFSFGLILLTLFATFLVSNSTGKVNLKEFISMFDYRMYLLMLLCFIIFFLMLLTLDLEKL